MINESSRTHSALGVRTRRMLLCLTGVAVGGCVHAAGVVTASGASRMAQSAAVESAFHPISFADVIARVKPAVISVRVRAEDTTFRLEPGSPLERFFRQFGFGPDAPFGVPRRPFRLAQGSGFFVSADGYAVTNNHVVANAAAVEVTTDDGRTYAAKVVGTDALSDIALLKVDDRNDFPFVQFADKTPRIGDWVLAVGNPFGLGGTVTVGIVSAHGRNIGAGPYDDFIQFDAPVNKGNSGGPAFDVDGRVIGVTTAIVSPTGGWIGIGFAIPAETAKAVVAQLMAKGVVIRGWLGVQIQTITPDIAASLGLKEAAGALVAEPQPDAPAAKAGIAAGDVITAVDGTPVKDARDLAKRISAMAPGTKVVITLMRKGEERTITLALGELPAPRQARLQDRERPNGEQRLGLTVAPASSVAGAGTEGVVVVEVEAGSPAAERGFTTGDVILDVGGQPVASAGDVRAALAQAQIAGKNTVLMRVKKGQTTRYVAVPVSGA